MQEIGGHRLSQLDINGGIDALMQEDQADIVYVDPPWGAGHEKFFHTVLRKAVPDSNVLLYSHDVFLDSLFRSAVEHTKNLVFMEYGIRWEAEIQERGIAEGLTSYGVIPVLYKAGKLLPYHLHIFSKEPVSIPIGYIESITGLIGSAVALAAVTPFAVPGGILLDPCCGHGAFAKIAVKVGMRFFGNEFNPMRLAKTEKFLSANI